MEEPMPIIPGVFCTIGPSAVTGELCGRPAVVTFTRRGRTFAECAQHAPTFARHPAQAAESRSLSFRGVPFRTATTRRFVLVRLTASGDKVEILRRSDFAALLHAEARRRGFSEAGVVDLSNGAWVRA